MALMTDKRVRHLPVLEGKKVIGIVSIGDLLKAIISKQKFVIDELEHYIRGSRDTGGGASLFRCGCRDYPLLRVLPPSRAVVIFERFGLPLCSLARLSFL